MSNANDISYVIEKIFIESPLPPCSYNIKLSENLSLQTNIFKVLMTIMLEGSKKIFGNSISVSNISQEQFVLLNEYMKSIGYNIKYEEILNDDNIKIAINVWFEPYIPKITCINEIM